MDVAPCLRTRDPDHEEWSRVGSEREAKRIDALVYGQSRTDLPVA